jgi:hypothetical protein
MVKGDTDASKMAKMKHEVPAFDWEEEMVINHELRDLDEKMDKFSREMAAKHPMSIQDAVLAARTEEDEEL